jgi:hypothetical protein
MHRGLPWPCLWLSASTGADSGGSLSPCSSWPEMGGEGEGWSGAIGVAFAGGEGLRGSSGGLEGVVLWQET